MAADLFAGQHFLDAVEVPGLAMLAPVLLRIGRGGDRHQLALADMVEKKIGDLGGQLRRLGIPARVEAVGEFLVRFEFAALFVVITQR
jgi:hypothetical protein